METGENKTYLEGLLRRNWRLTFIILALSFDTLAVGATGMLAYLVRQTLPNIRQLEPQIFVHSTLFFWIVLVFMGLLVGLYRTSFRASFRTQYREAAKAYLYSLVVTVIALYFSRDDALPTRYTLFFYLLLPFFFGAGRYCLNRLNLFLQRRRFGIHASLIIGPREKAVELAQRFMRYPELGYKINGLVFTDDGGPEIAPTTLGAKDSEVSSDHETIPQYGYSELPQLIREKAIDRIFVPMVRPDTARFSEVQQTCEEGGVKLKLISKESEDLLRFSYVKDIGGITLYSPPRTRIAHIRSVSKRAFDIAVSLLMVVLLAPIFILVSLAILIEDGWPIFFKQKRALVKEERIFDCFKFRSMVKDAEARQHHLYAVNKTSGGLFLLEDDPRLTRVGRFIRRFSIDELPQIFNVLRGEMALVGPRPLSLADLNNIDPHDGINGYYRLRGRVKPGMTGLWQICGRREVAFNEMVMLDLYYIENQSVMFDLEILFATLPVVLFGKGAY